MEHGGGPPAGGRLAQRLLGLVVAGDQHRRRLDPRQRGDRLVEALVDRGEVAGADHHVGVGRHLDQLRGLVEVAVQVAEGEQSSQAQT